VQGRWGLREPVQEVAEPEAVSKLLGVLGNILVMDFLDTGPPEHTGLDKPIAELTIESVACEWNAGETKQSHCFTPKDLALFEDSQPSLRKEKSAASRRRFCLPVELPAGHPNLIIKVQARGSHGGAVCAWSQLECPIEPEMQARADIKETATAR
jgi:hypothetical protein